MQMHGQRIKVLVVEESNEVRGLLVNLMNGDGRFQVVAGVAGGRAAMEFLTRQSPDVILMGTTMSGSGGWETARRIMETRPVPIVVCGQKDDPSGPATHLRLVESGAVAWVQTPAGMCGKDLEAAAAEIRQTLKLMSEVKVVRRWPQRPNKAAVVAGCEEPARPRKSARSVEIVGIGASTGGPTVVQTILANLPGDFPAPVLVVQHIAPGFIQGLVDWLNQTTALTVELANYGTWPEAGHVYLAPDDHHMVVGVDGRILLCKTEPNDGMRPSIANLFASLAEVYGPSAVGVLLTGMGKDGAKELSQMRIRGAFTIAQDRATSVVHGMPGEAIALDGASCVLPAEQIAAALMQVVRSNSPAIGEHYEERESKN
jgi:two-component system, chemotaxis family, protein-glutamate methylesterase/glutaminase